MDCCHITEILKNSYGKLSLVDFWAVHLVIHVKNGLSYMDSWAVANGVSCKSFPRRTRNGRSRSKISGEETCGSTDDSVHRMCGSLCRLIMLARDCELQRWHSTLGLQYVFPCVSHLCPLSPQCLHNGLMDNMIMVAGIKGVRVPQDWSVCIAAEYAIFHKQRLTLRLTLSPWGDTFSQLLTDVLYEILFLYCIVIYPTNNP